MHDPPSRPDPSPAPPPGAPRAFYDVMAERRIDARTERGIRFRNHVVAKRIPREARDVLEIGPGEGWLTEMLLARGHRVVAMDISRGWLRRMGARPGLSRAAAAMTRLPFADGRFDAVVAAEVIEHIPGIETALAEAARVLKRRGLLVVTVPYRETLRPIACPECGARFDPNGHVHSFDEDRLDSLLRGAGLAPEDRYIGPTRFSRELVRRFPVAPLLPLLGWMDRVGLRTQRVSDTWMLRSARRR